MLEEHSLFHEFILYGSRNKSTYPKHHVYGFTFGSLLKQSHDSIIALKQLSPPKGTRPKLYLFLQKEKPN